MGSHVRTGEGFEGFDCWWTAARPLRLPPRAIVPICDWWSTLSLLEKGWSEGSCERNLTSLLAFHQNWWRILLYALSLFARDDGQRDRFDSKS